MKQDEYLRRREILLKESEKRQRQHKAQREHEKNELELMALYKSLPEFLTLRQIAILSGHYVSAFENVIKSTGVELEEREFKYCDSFFKEKGFTKQKYRELLQGVGQWPVNGVLANWWDDSQPTDATGYTLEQVAKSSDEQSSQKKQTRRRTRKTNLIRAIESAAATFDSKPSLNELWKYFEDDRDATGFIVDYKEDALTWIDTKGKLKDTKKTTVANHLSKIKA
ncbi:hypothetical protein HC024_07655 [Methylococcaceae bacterium WWC4]|nr:hypothetical protein [Methylococcaceae bacterium WWC4]